VVSRLARDQWRLVATISGGAIPETGGWLLTLSLRIIYCTSIKKELKKKYSLYYMLSIISSGNRGCCSSTVPIHEPPLLGMPDGLARRRSNSCAGSCSCQTMLSRSRAAAGTDLQRDKPRSARSATNMAAARHLHFRRL
jgi:hypothetical protein